MTGRKSIRTRGKIQLSKYFQKFVNGDRVAVTRDVSFVANFPIRLQGKTGVVEGKRGSSYIVKIKDIAKEKEFIIKPIHLKKINQVEDIK